MEPKSRGQMTVKVAETLSGYYKAKGFDVLYDHASPKANVGKIVSWFGDTYSRESELIQLDIAILRSGSDQVVALIEIEETADTVKGSMGALVGVLLGDHIRFRGERELSVGEFTTLIVLGKSTTLRGKRNAYLREQAVKIRSGLDTGNAALGTILVETYSNEAGLYALVSSLLGKVLRDPS